MRELTLITEQYYGKTLTLTVSQWSKLLNVPKKTLYGRRSRGKKGDDFLFGSDIISAAHKNKIEKEFRISEGYKKFNYSYGIINTWRQKNGIR